jgi:hypothetical protein
MNKPSTKKMLTVLISLAMVFSALAVISMAAEPAYAASSGTFSLNPTVFAVTSSTVVLANGGSFSAGATITFYANTVNTFPTGEISIGTVTLPAGQTTLSNTAVTLDTSTLTAGDTYYTAATDGSGYAAGPQITISSLVPTITLTLSTAPAGSTETVSGSGFDPGATISLYLNYPTGPSLGSPVTTATGTFTTTFTVPTNIPEATYTVVAQETSSSSPNYPITVDGSLGVEGAITVSSLSVSQASVQTETITGHGFEANAAIGANSISLSLVSGETNPAVTTDSTGSFTVTVTFDSASVTGGVTVGITTSPASTPTSFSDAFYVSAPNPAALGFTFAVPSPAYVGSSVLATVFNFPASQTVQVYLGPVLVGSITTNSIGFGQLASSVPAMPAATYTAYAEIPSSGIYASSYPYTIAISSYFDVIDPAGNVLLSSVGEYVPYTGNLTVQAYGLTPGTQYDITDSLAGDVFADSLYVAVPVGTVGTAGFYPAANGTLIVVYNAISSPSLPTGGFATGTSATITMTPTVSPEPRTMGYLAIGPLSFTSPSAFGIFTPGATETLEFTGAIPFGSAVFPGYTYYYNAYVGSDELTLTFGTHTQTELFATGTPSATFTGTFTEPTLMGLFNLSITYNTQPVSSAIAAQYVIVSSSGSSPSSGTLVYVPSEDTVVGYGYFAEPDLYYMTSTGVSSVGAEPLTDGAFSYSLTLPSEPAGTYSIFTEVTSGTTIYTVETTYTVTPSLTITSPSPASGPVGTSITASATGLEANAYYDVYFAGMYMKTVASDSSGAISSISVTVPTVPAGMYNLTLDPSGTTTAVASATFAVIANPYLTLSTMSQYAFPGQLVQFSADVGSFTSTIPSGATVTYSAEISLNGTLLEDVPAAYSSGYISGSFKMPNNLLGSYYEIGITGLASYTYTEPITTAESMSLIASAYTTTSSTGVVTLTVTFTDPSYGTLTTAAITAPGSYDLETSSVASTPYYAAVSSFTAPTSSAAGSITFSIDTILPLTTTYADYITSSPTSITVAETPSSGTATSSTETVSGTYVTYTNQEVQFSGVSSTPTVSDFFGLIQGNGALLTGISSSEIATITADVTNAVTTSMKVPLSELNASVVAINGVVAKIDTAFGNMTAALSSINATVASISSGQALVVTDLGTIETSLSSLNASLVSVSGNVATLSTTLGTVQASLSSINATVTSSASSISGLVGSVATIQTSLGTISGTITSISNGMATIQTDVGTINASASQIATSVGQVKTDTSAIPTLEIFLIVTIVLVLITLVVAFLAVNSSNKLAKKLEEQKKQ